MNATALIKTLLLKLLFLTPLGYILSLFSLLNANETNEFGVKIYFPKTSRESLSITVVQNPTFVNRMNWFGNGIILLTQSFIAVSNDLPSTIGKVGTYYIVMCFIFGFVQLLIAIWPNIDWNKKL